MTDNLQALALSLGQWLRDRGQPMASVTNLRRSSNGFSNITLQGHLTSAGTPGTGIVVRIQPEGSAVYPDCDVSIQYRTMSLLQDSGLPVPRLRGLETASHVLGAPFFVMDEIAGRVPGENPTYHAEGWFHDLTPAQLRQHWFAGVEGFAALAGLDWRALGFAFLLPPQGVTPLAQQLDYYEAMLRWSEGLAGRPYALLGRALAWLTRHQPENEPVVLSWGDAKLGNCVFGDDGRLTGMLDWERPALANPVDDLAWWLMLDDSLCTGYGMPRLAGLPSRAETVTHWERASGFSAIDLPYYDVYAAWRLAIVMTRIGRLFTERGWVTPEAAMDVNNGATHLVERFAAQYDF